MKNIGRTLEGKYIIELEQEEYSEFRRLENAVTGKYLQLSDQFSGVNMAPVFKALSDLATAKHSITVVQSYINNLANYFGQVSLPKEKNT